MEFSEKTASIKFPHDSVKSNSEVMKLSSNVDNYCEIYKELAELIGETNTKRIWSYYRGLSVQFPQRLYSKEFTRKFIAKNLDTMKPKEMAKYLNLTERRVRQIAKDVKDMMDGYDEFFNEYVDFMKNYKSSDNILGMVADYGKYMNSYLSMMKKFEAIDKDELSTADAAYYVEVSGRILKKLAEIAQ